MSIEVKLAFDVLAFISVMVLIVLGLGVIASMMGIFNFAHGEFVLLGAYTVYLFESFGLSAWAGILAAPVVAIGRDLYRYTFRRLHGDGPDAAFGAVAPRVAQAVEEDLEAPEASPEPAPAEPAGD